MDKKILKLTTINKHQQIQEILNESEQTYYALSKLTGYSVGYLRTLIKRFNLQHRIKSINSYGCEELYDLCKTLYPGLTIEREYCIGNRLRIDIFLKEYNIGIEFDGIQHNELNKHFHKFGEKFMRSKERDNKKQAICEKLGISLLRFQEIPTEQQLLDSIDKAYIKSKVNNTTTFRKEKLKIQQPEWYIEKRKQQNEIAKQYRKQQYQRKKEWKNQILKDF